MCCANGLGGSLLNSVCAREHHVRHRIGPSAQVRRNCIKHRSLGQKEKNESTNTCGFNVAVFGLRPLLVYH